MPKERGDISRWRMRRDRELLEVYYAKLRELNGNTHEAVRQAVSAPCSRFWVDTYTAYNVVLSMMKGTVPRRDKISSRKEMYDEIYRRVLQVMKEHGARKRNIGEGWCTRQGLGRRKLDKAECLWDAVRIVVTSPAPKFYLSEGSGVVIICKAQKRR